MSRAARICNLLTLAGGGRFVGNEARSVGRHAVQNHGELAGERDLGLARCAVEMQHATPERNTGVAADNRIGLHIGVNLGT
jgi:hypothetical protein